MANKWFSNVKQELLWIQRRIRPKNKQWIAEWTRAIALYLPTLQMSIIIIIAAMHLSSVGSTSTTNGSKWNACARECEFGMQTQSSLIVSNCRHIAKSLAHAHKQTKMHSPMPGESKIYVYDGFHQTNKSRSSCWWRCGVLCAHDAQTNMNKCMQIADSEPQRMPQHWCDTNSFIFDSTRFADGWDIHSECTGAAQRQHERVSHNFAI